MTDHVPPHRLVVDEHQPPLEYWPAALLRIERRRHGMHVSMDDPKSFDKLERLVRLEQFARACLLIVEGEKTNGPEAPGTTTRSKPANSRSTPSW